MTNSNSTKRNDAKKKQVTESLDITRLSIKARGRHTVRLVVAALTVIALVWIAVYESKPNITASGPNSMAIGAASGPIIINNATGESK